MTMKQRIHKKRICIAVHKSSSSTEGCECQGARVLGLSVLSLKSQSSMS